MGAARPEGGTGDPQAGTVGEQAQRVFQGVFLEYACSLRSHSEGRSTEHFCGFL